MEVIEGTVIIKILKATLSHDTELFAKMAPYCTIQVGSTTSKTTVKKNFGRTPEWFEVFSFSAKLGEEVKIKVWDRDAVGSDDLVGEASVTTKKEFINMKYCFWLPLIFKVKSAGQLQVDIEFIPSHDSLNTLMGFLETELKEKTTLLAKYQHKPGEPIPISSEVLNSKEETTKKIQELTEQINQLKIEFQTKNTEIQQQTKANQKINEDLKKALSSLETQLSEYQIYEINGTIKINLLGGILSRDVGSVFDSQDPFVLFSLGNNQVQSKVKKDAGKAVSWNETLSLQRSYQNELRVEVIDYEESKKHHCIGHTEVSIKECVHSGQVRKFNNTKIWYRGEEAGEISFEVQFIRA